MARYEWNTKYILKKAFIDLIPEPIRNRSKMGFSVPLGTWLRHDLREYLLEVLLSPNAYIRDYLQLPYLRRLIEEHLSGKRDHGHRLWMVLTFEVWLRLLRQHFEKPKRQFVGSYIHTVKTF